MPWACVPAHWSELRPQETHTYARAPLLTHTFALLPVRTLVGVEDLDSPSRRTHRVLRHLQSAGDNGSRNDRQQLSLLSGIDCPGSPLCRPHLRHRGCSPRSCIDDGSEGRRRESILVESASCCPLTAVPPDPCRSLPWPSQRSCFYSWVDQAGEKIGWYFAVQSGGNFEIDWSVTSPSQKIITEGRNERQMDIIFTGQEVGEYQFCFEDPTFAAEKVVDFDITVESEPRLSVPLSQVQMLKEHSVPLEESIGEVQQQLTSIGRTQRYFRTWENRGFDTVKSTQCVRMMSGSVSRNVGDTDVVLSSTRPGRNSSTSPSSSPPSSSQSALDKSASFGTSLMLGGRSGRECERKQKRHCTTISGVPSRRTWESQYIAICKEGDDKHIVKGLSSLTRRQCK